MRKRKHELLLKEARHEAFSDGHDDGYRDGRAVEAISAEVASISHPRVNVTSVFRMAATGAVRCAGALTDIPWNPHSKRIWPQFEVSFNGGWVLVEVTDWHQDVGWVAQSAVSLVEDDRIAPRVKLELARERTA